MKKIQHLLPRWLGAVVPTLLDQVVHAKKADELPQFNDRIAIVGAGPAGVKMATVLKHKGYQNVRILEQSDRAGGKVNTETYWNHGGCVVDHGAIQVGPNHHYVNWEIQKLGLNTYEPKNGFTLMKSESGVKRQAAGDYYFPSGQRMDIMKEMWRFDNHVVKLRKSKRMSQVDPEYWVSFAQFAKERKFERVAKLYEPYVTSFGYGNLDAIPAVHAIKYVDESIRLPIALWAKINMKNLTAGYQGLISSMIDRYGLQVQYGTKIREITRKGKQVEIQMSVGEEEKTEQFDWLVIACPIDKIFATLQVGGTSKAEQQLDAGIVYAPYHVVVADVKGLPKGGYVLPEQLSRPGHVQLISNNSKQGNLSVLYIPLRGPMKPQQMQDQNALPTIDQTVETLRNDLATYGFKEVEVVATRHWHSYFPHFETASGYETIEAIQSEQRTFWIGTMGSRIDMVDPAFESAVRTANEYFPGKKLKQKTGGIRDLAKWYFCVK